MSRKFHFVNNIAEYNGKFYYRANAHGKTHPRRAYGARNRSDAEKMLREELRNMELETAGLKKPSTPVPLSKLCQLYDTHNKNNNRSKTRGEKKKVLQEFWGLKKDARQIKRGDIEKWRTWLKEVKKLSNSTINKYTCYLSVCYKLAIQDDLLEDSPLKFINKLEEPKENVKFLTKAEMQKVRKALESFPRFNNFVLLVILTGFRVSNVNYMRWEWIDIKNRLIHIKPQDNKGSLEIYHEISDEILKIFESIGIKKRGYVFPLGQDGRQPYANPQRDIINKVFKKAGIDASGFHIFRHTVGTTLAENNKPFKYVQSFLHHKDPRTSLKYIHMVDFKQSEGDSIMKDFIGS